MDNQYVKKLTGKNSQDYEFAAAHIINNSDVEAFSALVEKSDFLFEFIKENVKKRLANVITNYNYKNLLNFLKIYSADYEDLIVSTLVKFADEELTDEMLERLEHGCDDEKAYCAKYFSRINDTLATELLKKYSYSDFDALALNSAEALSALGDVDSYNSAMEKLKSEDDFEKLSAVRFLVAYKNQKAIPAILEAMKKSAMPENIASEICYLQSFCESIDGEQFDDSIIAINHIINGLGEIISLGQVFDCQLFELLEKLINNQHDERKASVSVVLLNAKLKFEQLTENDEYIFDEEKVIKEEIYGIKDLLNYQTEDFWSQQAVLFQEELNESSKFIFTALELVSDLNLAEAFKRLETLLNSSNQTIILKTVEVVKSLNKLSEIDKNNVLNHISDENIKLIIQSLFI